MQALFAEAVRHVQLDRLKFRVAFLPEECRQFRRDGVYPLGVRYWSPPLRRMSGMTPAGSPCATPPGTSLASLCVARTALSSRPATAILHTRQSLCGSATPASGGCGRKNDTRSSQSLDRRIADKQTLAEEAATWESSRNKNHTKADWQFTTANARVKLKRWYPLILSDSG
jgi:hypothetical protein